jgi:hypothetical protein
VQLERNGVKLKWRAVPLRSEREQSPAKAEPKAASVVAKQAETRTARPATKPAATHPWRVQRIGSARRRAERLVVGDSGRPPLRSGLPASPTTRRRENNQQPRGHFLLSS